MKKASELGKLALYKLGTKFQPNLWRAFNNSVAAGESPAVRPPCFVARKLWSKPNPTNFWSEIFVCFISYAFSISKGKFTEHSGFRKKPENLKLCEDILVSKGVNWRVETLFAEYKNCCQCYLRRHLTAVTFHNNNSWITTNAPSQSVLRLDFRTIWGPKNVQQAH